MPLPVSTSTQQPSQPQGTPDPYLTHFDPRSEHQSYKQAQMRLEEVHKEKVTKVSSINRNSKNMARLRVNSTAVTYIPLYSLQRRRARSMMIMERRSC